MRLDPCALPVCYATSDARADERLRFVELGRERVVVRRTVRGVRMRLSLKVSEFLGVAIRVQEFLARHRVQLGRSGFVVRRVALHRYPALGIAPEQTTRLVGQSAQAVADDLRVHLSR